MSTLKVVNLQNPASSNVNLAFNADGSSTFLGPVTFPAGQIFPAVASATAPLTPPLGTFWYDLSVSPYSLKIWNGSAWVADGGGTVTAITAGTGLNGGTITSTGTISLANTSVAPGNYCYANISVDAQGRLTAASAGAAATTSTLGLVFGCTNTANTAIGLGALAVTTGPENAAFGCNALATNVTGLQNTAIGDEALANNTSGCTNTAIGWEALRYNTTGLNNTAIGGTALCCNTTGCRNTAVGRSSMRATTTGCYNTAVGTSTLCTNTIGDHNAAFGNQALRCSLAGSRNTGLGSETLFVATGSYNTAVGNRALFNLSSGNGNIAVGGWTAAGAYSPVCNLTIQDDRIVMGSTAVTNAYIQVAWQVISDARDKNVEGEVPHGLEFVNALKPVAFRFKESRENPTSHGPLRYGFLAQDILALEGEPGVIIDGTNPEKLSLQSESLVPVLVNAIQELAKENKELRARLDAAGI
jgi:hypothetical protein